MSGWFSSFHGVGRVRFPASSHYRFSSRQAALRYPYAIPIPSVYLYALIVKPDIRRSFAPGQVKATYILRKVRVPGSLTQLCIAVIVQRSSDHHPRVSTHPKTLVITKLFIVYFLSRRKSKIPISLSLKAFLNQSVKLNEGEKAKRAKAKNLPPKKKKPSSFDFSFICIPCIRSPLFINHFFTYQF